MQLLPDSVFEKKHWYAWIYTLEFSWNHHHNRFLQVKNIQVRFLQSKSYNEWFWKFLSVGQSKQSFITWRQIQPHQNSPLEVCSEYYLRDSNFIANDLKSFTKYLLLVITLFLILINHYDRRAFFLITLHWTYTFFFRRGKS